MEKYELNPNFTVKVIHIESENEDIIIVDNFLKSLQPVFNFATQYAYLQPPGSDGTLYPGKRDDMPTPYFRVFSELIDTLLQNKRLKTADRNLYLHRCKLSLVTQKPDQLAPLQRIPHIDSSDDKSYASVHYLVGPEFGGTTIYRYKPHNLIKITKDKEQLAFDMIKQAQECADEHQGYLNSNTTLFEQVVNIEAKVNRVIIYKSNLLHSANIMDNINFNADIRTGRLSVASFFRID
ncbi:DUF6445 family protein [Pseudoalteromonas mariniglutinosa]|uniref:DUF6445 family protein n=1 Tax=Pseudoalteromonas mariniglutinosa TaxID=206042 RepID=UPI00384BD577